CAAGGGRLFITSDLHALETLEAVRTMRPDLGIVYATRILKPELFEIPRLGSINIHQRKVPDYRGGGPIGLWDLLDRQKETGVTVHRVPHRVATGPIVHATTIPIESYDTLQSLALKADVVGTDLLVRSISDFAHGLVQERPQQAAARTFRNP